MTRLDVEHFIFERCAHIRSVRVEEEPGIVIIKIELTFLYWLFHRRRFFRHINGLIQERKLAHLKYVVKVQ